MSLEEKALLEDLADSATQSVILRAGLLKLSSMQPAERQPWIELAKQEAKKVE